MKGRPSSLSRQIAESVALPPQLLPVARELFADLPSLGSSPRKVVGLLTRAGLGRNASVVDLACGKATTSIMLAAQLGCRSRAVDAFEPFINEGRARANRAGVSARITWLVGDVARTPRRWRGSFDAALMLGLWPFDHAAPLLRSLVRPRGLYVLDDAISFGLRRGPTRADASAFFASLGDEVVATDLVSPSRMAQMSRTLTQRLVRRARDIQARGPHLAAALDAFLADHRRSARVLATSMRSVTWVVRRGQGMA